MKEEDKKVALEIIALGLGNIVHNYTENALLINSCFVAAERYRTLTETDRLSTTASIPSELRLDHEVDVQYTNASLVKAYKGSVQIVIFQNYIIASVSIVDATLEDLYEHLIKVYNHYISEAELEKQIRNAWTNDSLLKFFTADEKAGLKKPSDKETDLNEAFMRYNELRIIRHTLVHTNGKLSGKNLKKLQENLINTPAERKHFALINSPLFDKDRNINLSINITLLIRQYLNRFLMFVYQSIKEK